MNTKLLSYYLSEAVKGNAEASYKAGKLMASEGTFNEVAVQMRYIEAAKAGFTEAQKELGALGLCGRLITSDATAYNIRYYTDYNNAIMWLKKAAQNGDPECTIVVAAIEKYGTRVIDEARKSIELYHETMCSSSFISSPCLMLFEVAMQLIDPFNVNKYNEMKIA